MIRLYTFLMFVAICTIIMYLVFATQNFDFEGNTSLLIIPEKSWVADNTVEDIAVISQIAISENKDIKKYSADAKISKIEGSDILQVKTYANSEQNIIIIEKSVLKGMLIEIEKYYEINSDFSIKIVGNQSIQKMTTSSSVYYGAFLVILVGVFSAIMLLFNFFDNLKKRKGYDENISGEKIFAKYNENKTDQEEILDDEALLSMVDSELEEDEVCVEEFTGEVKMEVESQQDIEDVLEEESEGESEEENQLTVDTEDRMLNEDVAIPEGLMTTPGNLPVADISDFGGGSDNGSIPEDVKTGPTEEDHEAGKTEPTEEELKARLNELLNGKL